jgi:predicted enzyme related to lactoylglutathione lyase
MPIGTRRIGRILLYVKDVKKTVAFYERHFDFGVQPLPDDRIVELVCPNGGANLMIHQAGKAQKKGQSTVKLVFDVEDVEAFAKVSAKNGLDFGKLHKADGYVFANAKDPNNNPISISSRAFRNLL